MSKGKKNSSRGENGGASSSVSGSVARRPMVRKTFLERLATHQVFIRGSRRIANVEPCSSPWIVDGKRRLK